MTSETFEQVLAAAQAAGSITPAWKKFVNTRFFVPVLGTADIDPKKLTLHVAPGAHEGGPAVTISEVRERLAAHPGATLATLTGADVVRLMQAEAAILVALSGSAFSIAKDRVDWLKKGIEASQARAAAKAREAAGGFVPLDMPAAAEAPAAPAPVAIAKPVPEPALVADPVRRNQVGVLDVAALKPRSVSLASVGLEFFVPAAWREIKNNKGLKFIDDASGSVIDASGMHRPGMSLMQWNGMRMALVQHDMRYLVQDGESYTIDGEGWRDRVKGMVTEFAGTFPGDDFPSRYLLACIWIDGTVAAITVRAPAAAFEQHRQLYKWLLSRVDILASAAIEARMPLRSNGTPFEDESSESPGVFGLSLRGRITRLQALAYSFPVYLPLAAAAILAAVVMPKNKVAGITMLVLAFFVTMWLGLRLLVLRLHDANISGKWILYYLGAAVLAGIFRMPLLMAAVLGIGWLAMMVFYCLVPGTPDDNDFGEPPGENSNLVKLGAILFIVLQVGMVAGPAKMAKSPGGFGNQMGFGAASGQAHKSVTFMPADGSFSVDMPGEPELVPMPPQAQAMGVSQMYQLASQQGVYIVQTMDLGRGTLDHVGTIEAMQASLVGSDGTLMSSTTILLNGMKGREVRVALPLNMMRAVRFIIVGAKIIMVAVVTTHDAAGEALAEDFLTSFKLN
ncbi:MAG: DUF805 domain-containing protein [Pseudomonadota bacterium]